MDQDFMGYEFANVKCPTCGIWYTKMELDGSSPWCSKCQNEHDHNYSQEEDDG